jgi:hypothetical protein
MVNVDRREIASWSTTPDVEDGYEFSYAIWNQTYPTLGVQVEYTDTWRHGSTLAEDGSTALVVSSWKMTEGNDFMFLKEGSIVSATPESGWTSVDIVGHIDVAQGDEETMISYITDMYADIVACVSGDAYPTIK